jgi:hypothetical protein
MEMMDSSLLIIGMAVAGSVAALWIDRKDRLRVANDLEIEVTVMREAMKRINEAHNGLMAQGADNAGQIAMLTERLSILLQGIGNGR